MKNIKILFLAIMVLFAFSSCEEEVEAPGTNYVTFESTDYTFEVTPGGDTTRDLFIYSANKTGSARTFSVSVLTDESSADPSIYSVPSSVTIPADSNVGNLSVTASDANDDLSFSSPLTVVLKLEPEAGLSVGEKMTVNLLKECIYNKVFFNIEFDSWPEEIYWAIVDNNSGATVAESATPPAYGAYAGLSGSLASTLCIPDGDYTFYIYDAYGDGAGPVSLSAADGTVLVSSSGAYGSGTAIGFSLP